jgi:ankyrin repeat protein
MESILLELIGACVEGDLAAGTTALDSGADPDGCHQGCAALHWAVQYDHEALVALLLARGAAADRPDTGEDSDFRPIATAAGLGNVTIVRALLDAGAEPNTRSTVNGGSTALHHAAAYGNLECAKLLVERGASTEMRDDDGHDAIHFAKEHGEKEVVEWLEANRTA